MKEVWLIISTSPYRDSQCRGTRNCGFPKWLSEQPPKTLKKLNFRQTSSCDWRKPFFKGTAILLRTDNKMEHFIYWSFLVFHTFWMLLTMIVFFWYKYFTYMVKWSIWRKIMCREVTCRNFGFFKWAYDAVYSTIILTRVYATRFGLRHIIRINGYVSVADNEECFVILGYYVNIIE